MPRKRETKSVDFYDVFPERLREVMQEHGTTQQELAEYIGKSRQAIGYYADGSSSPDWKTLAKIAQYFEVSADWLLGTTDVQSTDIDVQKICNYLGLSEQSVLFLHNESADTGAISAFDRLLRTNGKLFHRLSVTLFMAFQCRDVHPYSRISTPFVEMLPEDMQHIFWEALGKWGGCLLGPQESSDYYLSQAEHIFRTIIDAASYNAEHISLSDI